MPAANVPFFDRDFRTPFECQAIFSILPANPIGLRELCAALISLNHGHRVTAFKARFLAQDGPSYPRQLVG